jgi:hypothetical protein
MLLSQCVSVHDKYLSDANWLVSPCSFVVLDPLNDQKKHLCSSQNTPPPTTPTTTTAAESDQKIVNDWDI